MKRLAAPRVAPDTKHPIVLSALLSLLVTLLTLQAHRKIFAAPNAVSSDAAVLSSSDASVFNSSHTDPDYTSPECRGRERVLALIRSALPRELNSTTASDKEVGAATSINCSIIPPWSETSALYGDRPVVIGMDTCAAYRKTLAEKNATPMIRWAGLFNSGTNALKRALSDNLKGSPVRRLNSRLMDKHIQLHYWYNHTRFNPEQQKYYLSVVIVRDPYRWSNRCVLRHHHNHTLVDNMAALLGDTIRWFLARKGSLSHSLTRRYS